MRTLGPNEVAVDGKVVPDLRASATSLAPTVVVKIPYTPREVFRAVHADARRFKVIVAHRRLGKTVGSINAQIKRVLMCTLPDPRGAYIAPTFTQAKEIAWNYYKYYARGIPGVKFFEGELKVAFPGGGQIKLWGSDSIDRLRGVYHDDLLVDEFGNIDAKMWPEVLRPTLMDRMGHATFIGTPKGKDAFHDMYRLAMKNPAEWGAYMFKASETGILPQSELDDAKTFMSPDQYAREFECSFEVSTDTQFISLAECEEATKRPRFGYGPVVLGCDIARFGDDRTVVICRNGDILEHIWITKGLDLMRTAVQIAEFIDRFRPAATFVDGVGIGAGVVDRLNALGYGKIHDVNSGRAAQDRGRFGNSKAEMWSRMRNWIRDRAALEYNKELFDDLTSVNYDFDKRDRMLIETKDDLRSRGVISPDLADALALTFSQRMAPLDLMIENSKGLQAAPMIDPLAEFSR